MKPLLKRIIVALVVLPLVVFFITYEWPSIWARDVAVRSEMNAHLATMTIDKPEDAAYEAVHWNVISGDRVPRNNVKNTTSQLKPNTFKVKSIRSAQDDSIHSIYEELTLTTSGNVWTVIGHKRCWMGRGLFGWSTRPAS